MRRQLALLLIASVIVGVIGVRLWRNYSEERQTHSEMILRQGQTLLLTLEGGLRIHRRLGTCVQETVQSVLEEAATVPGVVGLGVYDAQGRRIQTGGKPPEQIPLDAVSRWTQQGVLVTRSADIRKAESETRIGQGMGWGRSRRTEGAEESPFEGDLHLGVLLDRTEYDRTMAKERWRLAVSLGVIAALLSLGMRVMFLVQRQGLLRAELDLACEREQRLEELARLGAGLAHETKNPLGYIRGIAQEWSSSPSLDPSLRGQARQIVEKADRTVGRISAFLAYARPCEPRRELVDVQSLVREMAALFQDEARDRQITLRTESPPCRALADPAMLRQVVVNLVANSIAFCTERGMVEIAIRPQASAGAWKLDVSDTGCGIAAEDLRFVGKPYFSRRPGGAGLGLSIVRQIVEAHGWRMNISSKPGLGTTVSISGLREGPQ